MACFCKYNYRSWFFWQVAHHSTVLFIFKQVLWWRSRADSHGFCGKKTWKQYHCSSSNGFHCKTGMILKTKNIKYKEYFGPKGWNDVFLILHFINHWHTVLPQLLASCFTKCNFTVWCVLCYDILASCYMVIYLYLSIVYTKLDFSKKCPLLCFLVQTPEFLNMNLDIYICVCVYIYI